MSLRAKITLYVISLHLVLVVAAAFVLREQPMLLFVAEAVFGVSVLVSVRLVRALFVPLDLMQTGAELIATEASPYARQQSLAPCAWKLAARAAPA